MLDEFLLTNNINMTLTLIALSLPSETIFILGHVEHRQHPNSGFPCFLSVVSIFEANETDLVKAPKWELSKGPFESLEQATFLLTLWQDLNIS